MAKKLLQLAAVSLMTLTSVYADRKDNSCNDDCATPKKPDPCYDPCDFAGKYTGFDFDIGIGYSNQNVEHEVTTSFGTSDQVLGMPGFAVKANVGGTYGFYNRWIVGLNVYGQYNTETHKRTFTNSLGNANTLFKANWDVGFDARIGVVARPSNMYYLSVGPDWLYAKHSHTAASVTTKQTKWLTGVRFGVGAEQMFSENWVIKEEVAYTWYQTMSHTHSATDSHTLNVQMGQALFSVGYLF